MPIHPMSPVDAAWFHMDGPSNTAVVTVLLTARHAFDFAAVKDQMARRLAPLAPFSWRVVEPMLALGPAWDDSSALDIAQHVHHRALPAGATESDLRELLEDLASQPLAANLPLWQMHVVDGPGLRAAVVFRYHHCMGDGAAMMGIARQVFGGDVPAPTAPPPPAASAGLLEPIKAAVLGTSSVVQELLKWPDPASVFRGPFGMRQRLARSAPIALARLKAIASAFDAKINDVIVAAAAGALRDYLGRHGQLRPDATLRAMVPVNLRPTDRQASPGNDFGLVILDLPIQRADALQRLEATKARMATLKASSEAVAMHGLFEIFGHGPKAIQEIAQHVFGTKVSLVITNVAGPATALHLAGRTIDSATFWVPHPGDDIGVGLSAISYRGKVTVGVIADARRLPDPERITARFVREIAALERAAAALA